MIEREDFEAWLDNPITQHVFKTKLARLREEAKEQWLQASWSGGRADPLLLADLRAVDRIAFDLINLRYEDIDEQERNSADRIQGADSSQGG